MKKKCRTVRDLKRRLANFAGSEGDEGLSKKELLFKKCAIINTQLNMNSFQHKGWGEPNMTPRELIQFLEDVSADCDGNGMVIEICSHLINVLEYLMDDRGVVEPPKYGLAVRKPTEALRAFINQEEKSIEEDCYNIEALNKRLFDAIKGGDFDNVKSLIELGVDVNARDERGRTPLMVATKTWKNLNILRYLISNGADINARDNNGETATDNALYFQEPKVVETLVEAGADVSSLLPYAVARLKDNDLPVIEAIVKAGADVNATNEDEQTALDVATFYGETPRIAEYLQSVGCVHTQKGKVTYRQLREFANDYMEKINASGRIIKSIHTMQHHITAFFRKNVAEYRLDDAESEMRQLFKDRFGFEPYEITWEGRNCITWNGKKYNDAALRVGIIDAP